MDSLDALDDILRSALPSLLSLLLLPKACGKLRRAGTGNALGEIAILDTFMTGLASRTSFFVIDPLAELILVGEKLFDRPEDFWPDFLLSERASTLSFVIYGTRNYGDSGACNTSSIT